MTVVTVGTVVAGGAVVTGGAIQKRKAEITTLNNMQALYMHGTMQLGCLHANVPLINSAPTDSSNVSKIL